MIVGYVDHVMDRVGDGLVGSLRAGHRGAAPPPGRGRRADRFVERLFGLELTQDQLRPGRRRSSPAWSSGPARTAWRRLWSRADVLPTPTEVDAPGLWLARIDL